MDQTRAQWSSLVGKEYLQEAISCIFAPFWRLGLAKQDPEGLGPDELDELIAGLLLGTGTIKLSAAEVPFDGEMLTRDFADAVEEVSADLSLEQLRTWAIGEATAIAGLTLTLVLNARLPDRETAPSQWARIGLQHSDRQPSLLGFAYLLDQHLADDPALAETLRWMTRRFVIAAHEQIAYSKLPDFTFRFRWEGGRLRFYPIGEGRFDLADMRRASMSSLSGDVGLWRDDDGVARLTSEGDHFVAAIFG